MKKHYNLDEMEEFLSDSAEQHRMYPSDRVWRNIDHELHGNKRWPALTFASILTCAVITAGLILIRPDKSLFTVPLPVNPSGKQVSTVKDGDKNSLTAKKSSTTSGQQSSNSRAVDISPASSVPFYEQKSDAGVEEQRGDAAIVENAIVSEKLLTNSTSQAATAGASAPLVGIATTDLPIDFLPAFTRNTNVFNSAVSGEYSVQHFSPDVFELSNLPLKSFDADLVQDQFQGNGQARNIAVVNKQLKNRWSFTVYGTPSMSYRHLSESKIVDLHLQNGPVAPNFTHGVNSFVSHKPILGYELGAGFLYSISPSVRLKTGLQLNLRGYQMEAYTAGIETSTIVLNRGYYNDSLRAVSSINTQNGFRQMDINNQYFEVGIPVGLDMKVVNWNKLRLYVGAAVQPTYQFNRSMYMISSDYKKYVQEPDLVRHWNVNTSIEAFATYDMGDVTWQIGPQIRYQMLPGAIKQYPIRERLIDYGLKIGVVKSLK